ncbi:hypothetical protein FHS57_003571 [Runella defluvii]|uniref:Uncharacterized protein n=1 Tax=Runella defluvii TaxID=370973 RepID=A0A7W5ZPY8_9BACT|nr:hypothetical protein [Runella defluvii]MBB3839562.1 hypothetical protein [Runella defluvii]
MRKLNHNWLTEGLIDFEYKKYVLKAYLQGVNSQFDEHKLYPYLPEVEKHFKLSAQLRQSKKQFLASFRKRIVGVDVQKMEFLYEQVAQSEEMTEIDSILDYSLPLFQKTLTRGQDQSEDIASKLVFTPVGIMPLYLKEGYLFIYRTTQKATDIFQYNVRLFESSEEQTIKTKYIESVPKNVANTFENLKLTLIQKRRELPNPATYLVESPIDYPVQETLLPLAKQMVYRVVCQPEKSA